MDPRQVLVKTVKGQEEIRTKAFNLSPELRRLLSLVDGHSTVGTILSRRALLGDDLEAQLEALLAAGFLAPGKAADAAAWQAHPDRSGAPPAKGPAEAPPPGSMRFNLEKAKGFARFILLGSLGPVGAYRLERIDTARTVGDLRAELRELRDILPKLLSKRQARQVWEQLEPLMSSSGTREPAARLHGHEAARASGAAKTVYPKKARERAAVSASDPTHPPLAERILEYAQPLTDAAAGTPARKRAVELAIMCWNTALLPGNRGLDTIAPGLREIAAGDRQVERELFGIFETMQARKRAQYCDDHRFIVGFSLADAPNGLHLDVESRLLSPDRADAES